VPYDHYWSTSISYAVGMLDNAEEHTPKIGGTAVTAIALSFAFAAVSSRLYSLAILPVLLWHIRKLNGLFPSEAVRVISGLIVMAVSGLLFADFAQMGAIAKDVWYWFKLTGFTLIGLLLGFQAPSDRSGLDAAAVTATAGLLLAWGLTSAEVYVPPLGPVMLSVCFLAVGSDWSREHVALKLFVGIALLLVMAQAQSRTTWIVAIFALIGVRGAFANARKIFGSVTVMVIIGLIAWRVLPEFDPSNYTFWGKVRNSLNELAFVVEDDPTEITTRWRGFEAIRAFETWKDAGWGERIFGLGLGTAVDLQVEIELQEGVSFREVPVLHNGYFMILVKYGVLGVVLFLHFVTLPFRVPAIDADPDSTYARNLATTASLVLLLTMASITGPFNILMLDGVTLLFGWSLGMQYRLHRIETDRATP